MIVGGRRKGAAAGGQGARRTKPSDLVTVYHRTSRTNAEAITRDGFRPTYARETNPGYVAENSRYAFVTRRPNAQAGYGAHVVKIKVRRADLERDPYSGHYRVPIRKIKRSNISR